MMTSHLFETLRQAELSVSIILSETTSLVESSGALQLEQLRALPKGPNRWREEDVKNFVRDLREALKGPVAFRSRELLKKVGIPDDQISLGILEDSNNVDLLVTLIEALPEKVATMLIEGKIVLDWLKEETIGLEPIIEKLKATSLANPVINELFNLGLPREVRVEFVKLAFDAPGDVRTRATELSGNIARLAEIGIDVFPNPVDLTILEQTCQAVSDLSQKLISIFSLNHKQIRSLVGTNNLLDAQPVMENEEVRKSEQLGINSRRWDMLAQTLQSLGEDAGEKPETLDPLIESIGILEGRCHQVLGDSGRLLHEFLVGNTDFPRGLKFSQTKEALLQLRPFILKGLGGESWPM